MLEKWLGFPAGKRLGDLLQAYRGIGPGFDLLRISLAFALFWGHAKWLAGIPSLGATFSQLNMLAQPDSIATVAGQWIGFTKPIKLALVPAFFALSGFLVMGSAFRLRSTPTFLAHRFLRIFPALAVEVLLSAFVLGSVLTSLPLSAYFSDPQFLRYFGNIVGWITFSLPGVFQNNGITHAVNINLWTLPAEFHCYLITAVLLMTRGIYHRTWFTAAFALATIGLAAAHYLTGYSNPTGPYPAHVMVYYFFAGVLAYHYQDKIPLYFSLFIACAVFCYVVMSFDALAYLAPLPLTYCTLFFGIVKFPKFKLLSSGDYSYGIYLYGFPITQAYVALMPQLSSHFLFLLVAAGTTTAVFAYCSWHLIEKNVLNFKKKLPPSLFPVPVRTKASA